jgi:hypothetical protein
MKPKKKLKPFTFHLDEDNRVMMEQIKKKHHISWGGLINTALRDYIDRHFNKDKIVLPLDKDIINQYIHTCENSQVDYIIALQQYIGNSILQEDASCFNKTDIPIEDVIMAINENADI